MAPKALHILAAHLFWPHLPLPTCSFHAKHSGRLTALECPGHACSGFWTCFSFRLESSPDTPPPGLCRSSFLSPLVKPQPLLPNTPFPDLLFSRAPSTCGIVYMLHLFAYCCLLYISPTRRWAPQEQGFHCFLALFCAEWWVPAMTHNRAFSKHLLNE